MTGIDWEEESGGDNSQFEEDFDDFVVFWTNVLNDFTFLSNCAKRKKVIASIVFCVLLGSFLMCLTGSSFLCSSTYI